MYEVISAKFYAGEQRVISGHVHINGTIDYSQKARTGGPASGSWQPNREEVDTSRWTILDPDKKKNRKVMAEGEWWFIEKGGEKIWF